MKRIVLSAALLALTAFTVNVSADEPGKERGKKRGGASQGQRDGARAAGGMRDRDPAVLIERMMKEFDKDGDQKLDVKELTALMTSMRERREGGQAQGRSDQARKRRGGQTEGQGEKGGAKPKRPE